MNVLINDDRCVLLHGDSAELGTVLAENTVDAIITDPPAGFGFMGEEWDGDKGGRDKWIAWLAQLVVPALLALKPGGYAFVWAIPRTSHWTATALENAGFEIRDVHHHLFGTGFPKSLTHKSAEIPEWGGTGLKPAVEHWILCRKPLEGKLTYAENFAKWGTGVMNIGACRILTDEERKAVFSGAKGEGGPGAEVYGASEKYLSEPHEDGRWPAHLTLDLYAAGMIDAQSGETDIENGGEIGLKGGSKGRARKVKKSTGGASRFFYVAKPAPKEKNYGLDHLPTVSGGEATGGRAEGSAGVANPRAGAGRGGKHKNVHPTVKSVALMQWLIRLITPPGGVVLDMFAGSGTTGVAALLEGFSFIGVEQGGENNKYLPILTARLNQALADVGAGSAPASAS